LFRFLIGVFLFGSVGVHSLDRLKAISAQREIPFFCDGYAASSADKSGRADHNRVVFLRDDQFGSDNQTELITKRAWNYDAPQLVNACGFHFFCWSD
jgi:hypothetical protein